MKQNESHNTPAPRDDAVVEALIAPGEGSFVDALLALGDEVANNNGAEPARRALSGGFQAALARRMREAIAQEGASKDAA